MINITVNQNYVEQIENKYFIPKFSNLKDTHS